MKPTTMLGRVAALVAGAMLATVAAAQCVTTHGPAGNPGTWTANAAGDVLTYSGTGLQYTKCQLGLSGPSCGTGAAQTLNWQQALQASVSARVGGYSDWRLPNLQEAAAFVDVTCSPALSPAFPSATAGSHWTSTSNSVSGSGDTAWIINSTTGAAAVATKTTTRTVILVRGSSTPAGNFDSLPPAAMTLAPSVAVVAQAATFNVVATLNSPAPNPVTATLAIATQPAGAAGALAGNLTCSMATGASSCTITGAQLTGLAGFYTFTATTSGGPAGGITVTPSAQVELLAGPSASLSAPASATQFAPFNVTLAMTSAAAADTTFLLARSAGPTGLLGGGTTCTVVTGATSCTFSAVTFTGYGNGLALSASTTAGPSVAVSGTSLNIDGQPVNIGVGTQVSALVGSPFSVSYTIVPVLPIPVTMTSQATSGPAGTYTPQSCTIPPGSSTCVAFGNTFSSLGQLVLAPLVTASAPILVQSAGNATIDIVAQGATLTAPATVTQFSPFNVLLTLAAGAAADTTFTLSRVAGPTGTLGGGTSCTVTTGNLSCTFTGVTFSGYGAGLNLTATVSSGPATPVSNAVLAVTAAPLSVVIGTPSVATVGTPFPVTLTIGTPEPSALTLQLQQTSGPIGGLTGVTTCSIPAGSTSCTLGGLLITTPGSYTFSAALANEVGIDVVVAPVTMQAIQSAQAIPTLSQLGLLMLLILTLSAGVSSFRKPHREDQSH